MNSLTKKILTILVFGALIGISETYLRGILIKEKVILVPAICSAIFVLFAVSVKKISEFSHGAFLSALIGAAIIGLSKGTNEAMWLVVLTGFYIDMFFDLFKPQKKFLLNFVIIVAVFKAVTLTMAILAVGKWGKEYFNYFVVHTIVNGTISGLLGSLLLMVF